jgi:peptidoglycan/LPS O-acetylase OafA/YrhL
LDALKGIAILAVVFDHAFLVDNYLVWKHSYFSVSWFIFLAGVSNTLSARRRRFDPLRDTPAMWRRRLTTLLGPYLWVSVVAYLVINHRHLTALALPREIVLFHALPPLYFIALLMQLLLAFPLLYWALFCGGLWVGVAALAGTVGIVTFLSGRITFPWVLGAHYLLGGTFLYLFVLGMLATPVMMASRPRAWLWVLGCLPAFVWAERWLVRTEGTGMTHPPTDLQMVYSVALLGLCYAAYLIFPRTPPARIARTLGRHSLDIFLYHYLFLLPFLHFRYRPWTDHLSLAQGRAVLVAVAIPTAIAGSLLAAWLSARLWRLVRRALGNLTHRQPAAARVSYADTARQSGRDA